jgi:hypothetical protein
MKTEEKHIRLTRHHLAGLILSTRRQLRRTTALLEASAEDSTRAVILRTIANATELELLDLRELSHTIRGVDR